MSRAMNLSLNVEAITALCVKNAIGISTIEPLQSGGTRVVTMTNDGALDLNRLAKSHLIDGPIVRSGEYRARPPLPHR